MPRKKLSSGSSSIQESIRGSIQESIRESRQGSVRRLARCVEARKLAEKSVTLSGSLEPADLPRVLEAVLELDQAVKVDIVFAFAGNGKPVVRVNVIGEAKMACQRCLDDVAIVLEVDNELTIVAHDEEAKNLQGQLEPIVLDDGILDIYALVEDEILLSLPIVSKHDESNVQCQQFFGKGLQAGIGKIDTSAGSVCGSRENFPAGQGASLEDNGKVTRRSQTGEANPFDRLKDLKVITGQE